MKRIVNKLLLALPVVLAVASCDNSHQGAESSDVVIEKELVTDEGQSVNNRAALNYGMVFLEPSIIVPGDPSSLRDVRYRGTSSRSSYNSNAGEYRDYRGYDFTVSFDDGDELTISVDTNVGSQDAGRRAADVIANPLGQIPAVLRREIEYVTVWDGSGRESATPSWGAITTYDDTNRQKVNNGFMEELFLHEVAHVSLDRWYYSDRDYQNAVGRDRDYISSYAQDNPSSEDIAETFGAYVAVRFKPDRISESLNNTISRAVRYRFEFLDDQNLDFYPITRGSPTPYNDTTTSELTSPSENAVISSSSQTFKWNSAGGGSQYDLIVGTSGPGSDDLRSEDVITGTSVTVSSLPSSGTLYVRLWTYVSEWNYVDYEFQMGRSSPQSSDVTSELTSPSTSDSITSPSQTFRWNSAGSGAQYDLIVGTTGPGSDDLRSENVITSTSTTVSNLPSSGTIYVRLWTYVDEWNSVDYTFSADSPSQQETDDASVITSPSAGARITSSRQRFEWTSTRGASAYDLIVGTSGPGSDDLRSENVITGTSTTVNNLPSSGTVYVRLWTYTGEWNYVDYTYQASNTSNSPEPEEPEKKPEAEQSAWSLFSGFFSGR